MTSLTPSIAVVFALILLAGTLFATERVPNEIAALLVAVLLAVLEPWTGVTAPEAISGFASPAPVTVLAMFILSEGIRATGLVRRLGRRLSAMTGASPRKRLAATLLLGGPAAGFMNNTPLVGVLVPAITDMSRRARTSPSRLLLPLSYAAMMGGTLTVIGTSTNLLASDLSGRLLDHPIGMFEFSALGLLVLVTGCGYLLLAGWRLVPPRVRAEADLTSKFEMRPYLARVSVPGRSPLLGQRIRDLDVEREFDLDVLQIARGERLYLAPTTDQQLEAGDVLTVRADPEPLADFSRTHGLEPRPLEEVADASFVDREHTLLEVTLAPDSDLSGETLVSANFRNRYAGTVIAIQRGDRVVRDRIERTELRDGDSLLVLVLRKKAPVLEAEPGLAVTRVTPADELAGDGVPAPDPDAVGPADAERSPASPALVLGIFAAVILTAAVGLWPIYIAALGGVVALVFTGCLTTARAYQAVSWDIYFLLAGILPLGLAMERTGAAAYLGGLILDVAGGIPAVLLLGLFYLLTALLTNLVSTNAAVVLMIPVAIDAAVGVGADPFAFLLAVTFGANTAFMTPVGNQTNLLVHTPGGYRFRDYVVAGAPLQLLLTVTVTGGIALFWGV